MLSHSQHYHAGAVHPTSILEPPSAAQPIGSRADWLASGAPLQPFPAKMEIANPDMLHATVTEPSIPSTHTPDGGINDTTLNGVDGGFTPQFTPSNWEKCPVPEGIPRKSPDTQVPLKNVDISGPPFGTQPLDK